MKKGIIAILFVSTVFLAMPGCSKSDDNGPQIVGVKFPLEVAANYVALAFCNATCGINYHMERTVMFSVSAVPGVTLDTVITYKKTDSAATMKYIYQASYNGNLIAGATQKYILDYTAPGSFNTPQMISNDQQNGNYTVTGFEPTTTKLTMNGSVTDGGAEQSLSSKITFTSALICNLKSIQFDKNSFQATGGSTSVRINCLQAGSGTSTDYSGTLTFNGGRKATLVLDTLSWEVSLVNGTMVKK
jgi:hypothetical protein